MYARVITGQYQPGNFDTAGPIIRDAIVPAAKQQPGFKGVLLLNNHTTGKGIAILLWETEADLKASEASSYLREQLGNPRLCWRHRGFRKSMK
ncbi:MAG: hypothetical protein NVS4B7_11980 [Ktedonobacteraceae bacterium]